jgi:hypothetical protein
VFKFTGFVTNTGDAILTNVLVFSIQSGTNVALVGPMDLAPGESELFSGSYTVTTNSNPAFDVVVASGMDTCQGKTFAATANCYGPVIPLVITSAKTANGFTTVTWPSNPGVTYRLQSISNVNGSAWINVPGDVTATNGTTRKVHSSGTANQQFYRVMIVQ